MEVKKRKIAGPNRQLRSAREQRGWSQKSLADLLGTTELTVGRWERGERSPQPFYRVRLCEAFGMTANELGLGEAEVPEEVIDDATVPTTQVLETSPDPGSLLPRSPILSAASKRQKPWSGRVVLLAVAVLSIFGGLGLYLTHPFPAASSRSGSGSARVSTGGTQPSNQSWAPPMSTLVLNDPLTQPDSRYHWGEGSICSFTHGGYHARSVGTNYCIESDRQFSDFQYQLQVTIQQGTQAGLAFRATGNSQLYYFYINITGHFGVQVIDAPRPHWTLRSKFSSSVLQGINRPNVLGVEVRGNTLRLFVNYTLVAQIQDTTFVQGYIGVCVGNYDDPSESELTLASFRNAQVWDFGGN